MQDAHYLAAPCQAKLDTSVKKSSQGHTVTVQSDLHQRYGSVFTIWTWVSHAKLRYSSWNCFQIFTNCSPLSDPSAVTSKLSQTRKRALPSPDREGAPAQSLPKRSNREPETVRWMYTRKYNKLPHDNTPLSISIFKSHPLVLHLKMKAKQYDFNNNETVIMINHTYSQAHTLHLKHWQRPPGS